ncbi:unnamed protein product [Anisakis simplex]|uniref:Dolichyl-diphosphooligosaccharide--protein glycosyltransferase subunit KCP2 n=1 Tax=Anisakis simplex TaxID=6269 RepID=A0A0M3JD37_ANISI|nr:unnamed protein product [Anisakis simplex]
MATDLKEAQETTAQLELAAAVVLVSVFFQNYLFFDGSLKNLMVFTFISIIFQNASVLKFFKLHMG